MEKRNAFGKKNRDFRGIYLRQARQWRNDDLWRGSGLFWL